MMTTVRRSVVAVIALLFVAPAWAQSSASVDEIVRVLRGGDHVIVVRHGATNADQAEIKDWETAKK